MTAALLSGFSLGLGLILAIGAQNAFVLRQGLRGEHVLPIVLTCAASDAVLVALGVSAFGAVAATLPDVVPLLRYAGAAFLLAYALRAAWTALTTTESLEPATGITPPLTKALATCLALTWLNPHVYLDTVVLLGGLSTQYDGHAAAFGLGAATASLVFFIALGYGARLLRPLFAKPVAWRVLDMVVATTMLVIGGRLALGV